MTMKLMAMSQEMRDSEGGFITQGDATWGGQNGGKCRVREVKKLKN